MECAITDDLPADEWCVAGDQQRAVKRQKEWRTHKFASLPKYHYISLDWHCCYYVPTKIQSHLGRRHTRNDDSMIKSCTVKKVNPHYIWFSFGVSVANTSNNSPIPLSIFNLLIHPCTLSASCTPHRPGESGDAHNSARYRHLIQIVRACAVHGRTFRLPGLEAKAFHSQAIVEGNPHGSIWTGKSVPIIN